MSCDLSDRTQEGLVGSDTPSKDVVRDAAGTEGTSLLSLSLSSEHFSFVVPENENEETVSSIDQASQLFTGVAKKPPTLEEALRSMKYEKAKELVELFTKRATEKLIELDAPGLTVGDIAVIFCYTFEWSKKKPERDVSPYRKLNNSLSVDRSNAALKKTCGFLFLLLQALRKLPRFVPENHTLYRGLRDTCRQRLTQNTQTESHMQQEMRKHGGHSLPQQQAWKSHRGFLKKLEAHCLCWVEVHGDMTSQCFQIFLMKKRFFWSQKGG